MDEFDSTEKSPYKIKLEVFEGPLDLLLHLIKKNEVNIYDIPIVKITEQYIEYVEFIQSLNLDLAGDFLAMTATLLYLKSKMLLPRSEIKDDLDDEGPTLEDLQRRLIEYQHFKELAMKLQNRELLGRDVFIRPPLEKESEETAELDIEEVSLFDLISALKDVIARLPDKETLEVEMETISLQQRINEIIELLKNNGQMTFDELFAEVSSRLELVVNFLALLELAKRRLVQLYQNKNFGPITILPTIVQS